jgi:DNA repair ATPase RecN
LQSSISGLEEDVQLVADTDIQAGVVSGLLEEFAEELDSEHDSTTERLEKIKAQNDICDIVDDTNTAEDWFGEVADVWTRRLETFYQFDLQLTAGSRRFEWVDEDLQSSVAAQREALDTFGGDWWTTDGWKALVGETKTNLSTELQQSWQDYIDDKEISSFVDRIDSHPWIVPATELPQSVQAALEREYITPLRELRRWFETMDEAIASLTSGEEDALVSATDDISEMERLTETIEYERQELESRLERLTAAVGDYSLDEIEHFGVVPDDRQSIDKRLERIVEKREVDVEQTDSRVIIR